VESYGISEVLRSEMSGYKTGDIVYGVQEFQAYIVWPNPPPLRSDGSLRIVKNEERLPLSVYLGVGGMAGKTAYYGLRAIAQPKAEESIFVSTAAGSVGQVVCQIAKAAGLRVIGSAGSDDKVRFLKEELRIDQAFNYKTVSTAEELKKFGGIDIYWDNVGGVTLEAALEAMNKFGRIVGCGNISNYNVKSPEGVTVSRTSKMFCTDWSSSKACTWVFTRSSTRKTSARQYPR